MNDNDFLQFSLFADFSIYAQACKNLKLEELTMYGDKEVNKKIYDEYNRLLVLS